MGESPVHRGVEGWGACNKVQLLLALHLLPVLKVGQTVQPHFFRLASGASQLCSRLPLASLSLSPHPLYTLSECSSSNHCTLSVQPECFSHVLIVIPNKEQAGLPGSTREATVMWFDECLWPASRLGKRKRFKRPKAGIKPLI